MAFSFEVVRHGARAPWFDMDLQYFTVARGMLTPEGMRQRYLLGAYQKKRYKETYKLLSEEYDPG
jgi:hypothetical protein